MSDLLQTGSELLNDLLESHAAQTASLSRVGSTTNAAVLVTLGETEFPRVGQDGLTTEERTQDLLVNVDQYTLDAAQAEPEPGDVLTVSGIGRFVVDSPGGNEPAWRYSGRHNNRYRIHTRFAQAST